MGITALFCSGNVPVSDEDVLLDGSAVGSEKLDAACLDYSKLVCFEKIVLVCTAEDSGNIGSDEVLTLADTDDKGAVAADSVKGIGMIVEENAESIGASESLNRFINGVDGIAVVKAVESLGSALGIGLGEEY